MLGPVGSKNKTIQVFFGNLELSQPAGLENGRGGGVASAQGTVWERSGSGSSESSESKSWAYSGSGSDSFSTSLLPASGGPSNVLSWNVSAQMAATSVGQGSASSSTNETWTEGPGGRDSHKLTESTKESSETKSYSASSQQQKHTRNYHFYTASGAASGSGAASWEENIIEAWSASGSATRTIEEDFEGTQRIDDWADGRYYNHKLHEGTGTADVVSDVKLTSTRDVSTPFVHLNTYDHIEATRHVNSHDEYDSVDHSLIDVAADGTVNENSMVMESEVSGWRIIHDTWTEDGVTNGQTLTPESYGDDAADPNHPGGTTLILPMHQGFAPQAYFKDTGAYLPPAPPPDADFSSPHPFWSLSPEEMLEFAWESGVAAWYNLDDVVPYVEYGSRWLVGDEMIDDPSVAAAGRVAWSGIAGVGNGAFDTIYTNLSLSLADPLEPIPSPRTGLYNISYFTTRVAGELVVAYFTSGGSAAGKAGKLRNVLRVTDALGNGVMAVRGAHDMQENGANFWNTLQLVGGTAGFGGNLVAGRWVDDVGPRVLDSASSTNRLSGRLYGPQRIAALRRYLDRNNVDLILDSKESTFVAKAFGRHELHLRSDPTFYEVYHELQHYRHLKGVGFRAFAKTSEPLREQYVYDQLRRSRHFWNSILNQKERDDAFLYILTKGGNPISTPLPGFPTPDLP